MALTSAQRASVRRYLGWSARFHQIDDELEQAMNALGSQPDDETIVTGLLTDCDSVAAAVKTIRTGGRTKATKVGNIQLRAPYELATLRSEGRQYTASIAKILGVAQKHGGFFSTASARSTPDFPENYLPHG